MKKFIQPSLPINLPAIRPVNITARPNAEKLNFIEQSNPMALSKVIKKWISADKPPTPIQDLVIKL